MKHVDPDNSIECLPQGGRTYLSQPDIALLAAMVAASLGSNGRIVAARFRVEHEEARQRLDDLERLYFIVRDGPHYQLRVVTLKYLEDHDACAKELLSQTASAFVALRDHYRLAPETSIQVKELANRTGLALDRAAIALTLLSQTSVTAGTSRGKAIEEFALTPAERILDFRSFQNLLDDSLLGHSQMLADPILGVGGCEEEQGQPTLPSSVLAPSDEHGASAWFTTMLTRGEGQALEYIESFPEKQVRELAKEIAAFATSNAGTILIGIRNDGAVVGLPNADTNEDRDTLIRRIEGLCSGTVKPPITPSVQFARIEDRVVLILDVPKGAEPVYYCGNVPYVRHVSQSRPAEPQEVSALIRAHAVSQ